jgi:hypothetical protein
MLREAGLDSGILIGSLMESCGWSNAAIPSQPRDWIDSANLLSLSPEPWIVTQSWIDSLRARS